MIRARGRRLVVVLLVAASGLALACGKRGGGPRDAALDAARDEIVRRHVVWLRAIFAAAHASDAALNACPLDFDEIAHRAGIARAADPRARERDRYALLHAGELASKPSALVREAYSRLRRGELVDASYWTWDLTVVDDREPPTHGSDLPHGRIYLFDHARGVVAWQCAFSMGD